MIHGEIPGLQKAPSLPEQEEVLNDPGVQYNMGKSQKHPVYIPTFLQKNGSDPAIKVSSP